MLARAREARGFTNYVLFQHSLHRVLSARAALTAGLACKAPSTETEAIVARASSGVTVRKWTDAEGVNAFYIEIDGTRLTSEQIQVIAHSEAYKDRLLAFNERLA